MDEDDFIVLAALGFDMGEELSQARSTRSTLDEVKTLVQDTHLVLDCSALELADFIAEAIGLEGGLHS